eukprot:44903-Rhodomonas_salina.3
MSETDIGGNRLQLPSRLAQSLGRWGTDIVYAATRGLTGLQVSSAVGLRACYVMWNRDADAACGCPSSQRLHRNAEKYRGADA